MIAIGIPSYNEADNIGQLTSQIDAIAVELNMPIIIINADNTSPDKTAEIFKSTKTINPKISLMSAKKGKGHNIYKIVQYIANHSEIIYCILVDGDVTSFDKSWLTTHLTAAQELSDFTVPNYARNWNEGNTTNHFVFPLLNHYTQNNSPIQPISGDFGLSRSYIRFLNKLNWPNSSLGYGVDLFLTMNALFNNMQVVEINLKRKIHKPSFDKMVNMFIEVAESYYQMRKKLSLKNDVRFKKANDNTPKLLTGRPINLKKLADLSDYAKSLLNSRKESLIKSHKYQSKISSVEWVEILLVHEANIDNFDSHYLAKSLLPYFLLRTVTYLSEITTPLEALTELRDQTIKLNKELKQL